MLVDPEMILLPHLFLYNYRAVSLFVEKGTDKFSTILLKMTDTLLLLDENKMKHTKVS